MSSIMDIIQGIIAEMFMMFLMLVIIIFVYLTPAIILITDFVFRYNEEKTSHNRSLFFLTLF